MSEGRFNLSALAVRERAISLFLILLISLAGGVAFFKLGRAEDPAFTIKVMTIVTAWPGATAQAGFSVPIASLSDAGKGPGVWVIQGEPAKVSWRPVKVQRLGDDSAYIAGQLKQGDRIVALGAHLLREGEQIRVAAQAPVTASARP